MPTYFDSSDDLKCVPLKVLVPKEVTDYHNTASVVGFFLGVLAGLLLMVLLGWLIWRLWYRNQKRIRTETMEKIEEERRLKKAKKKVSDDESSSDEEDKEDKSSSDEEYTGILAWIKKLQESSSEGHTESDSDTREYHALLRPPEKQAILSLSKVLVTRDKGRAYKELFHQDYLRYLSFEGDVWSEKFAMFMQIIRVELSRHMKSGALDEELYKQLLTDTEGNLDRERRKARKEHRRSITEMRKNEDLKRSKQAREDYMENLQRQYNSKMHSILKKQFNEIYLTLELYSEIGNKVIDRIMNDFVENLLKLERLLTAEIDKQTLLQTKRLETCKIYFADYVHCVNLTGNLFPEVASFAVSTVERQLDSRKLKQLNDQVRQIVKKAVDSYVDALESGEKAAGDKFKSHRLKKRNAIIDEFNQTVVEFLISVTNRNDDPHEVMLLFHEQMCNHQKRLYDFNSEMDSKEFKGFIAHVKTVSESIVPPFLEEISKVFNTQLSQSVDKSSLTQSLYSINARTSGFIEMVEADAKTRYDKVLPMVEQMISVGFNEDDVLARKIEMNQIKDIQRAVVSIVKNSQITLNENSLMKIELEHTANLHSMINQLQIAKIRQQKKLDLKIQFKMTKIYQLEMQDVTGENSEALNQKLRNETAIIEKEKEALQMLLRNRLAVEAEEAFAAHDDHLSDVVGRLLVKTARKRVQLHSTNLIIKELLENLGENMSDSAEEINQSAVMTALQRHLHELEKLSQNFADDKKQTFAKMEEKFQARQFTRDKELEARLNEDKRAKKITGKNDSLLMELMWSQHVENEKSEEKKETEVELHRLKDKLTVQLRDGFLEQIEESEKNLLAELATIAKISRRDLKTAIASLYEGTQNEAGSKSFILDLTERLKHYKAIYNTQEVER